MRNDAFQKEEEIAWDDLGEGLERQVLGFGDELMLVKVKFKTGAVGVLHSHPHVQASYVASGMFEVSIGDSKKLLKAGDGYYVPADVIHGVVCKEAGVLVDAFSPIRQDFL